MRDKKKVIPPSPSPSASSSSSLIRNYQFASIENRICNILMNITSNKVSLCVCKLFLMIITMDEQQQQQKKISGYQFMLHSNNYDDYDDDDTWFSWLFFLSFFLFLQFKLKFNNSSHVYYHQTVCMLVGWPKCFQSQATQIHTKNEKK